MEITLTYDHHPCLQLQPQSQVLVEILVPANTFAHPIVIINEIFTAPSGPTGTWYVMYIHTHGMT